MTEVEEQQICVKLCFRLGKTASVKTIMLKEAFGDNALGQTQNYECFNCFMN
jgi:hypothetical protein